MFDEIQILVLMAVHDFVQPVLCLFGGHSDVRVPCLLVGAQRLLLRGQVAAKTFHEARLVVVVMRHVLLVVVMVVAVAQRLDELHVLVVERALLLGELQHERVAALALRDLHGVVVAFALLLGALAGLPLLLFLVFLLQPGQLVVLVLLHALEHLGLLLVRRDADVVFIAVVLRQESSKPVVGVFVGWWQGPLPPLQNCLRLRSLCGGRQLALRRGREALLVPLLVGVLRHLRIRLDVLPDWAVAAVRHDPVVVVRVVPRVRHLDSLAVTRRLELGLRRLAEARIQEFLDRILSLRGRAVLLLGLRAAHLDQL